MSTALNGVAPSVAELDLDAILDKVDTSPKPVRLCGEVYMVRRDLTVAEANECLRLIGDRKELEATVILVGSDAAVRLDAALRTLPLAKQVVASNHLLRTANLPVGEGAAAGESSAS